ncbi:MAG: thioesterase family protein [Pikeienuella sp.]
MKDSLLPGLAHWAALTVDESLTVPRVSPHLAAFADMPPVFATAMMVGFVEATCIELMAPHLDDGEHSVGIDVNLTHSAATPVSMGVRAEVTLSEVDGRILTFNVKAFDDAGPIGEGVHKRAVILKDRFMEKVAAKVG